LGVRRESRRDGAVVLVADGEDVLDLEGAVLTAAGMKVSIATAGERAVDYLKSEDFDIVFLDSKIPGSWSSEDVFRWLEKHRPELAPRTVLVLSNVSDPAVRTFVDATKILCLVKPFEVSDLLAVVRRVLRRVKAASQAG